MTARDGRTASETVWVGMGEHVVTTDDVTLVAQGLGSCVGIGVYDEDAGVSGLAHVRLPGSPEDGDGPAADYVRSGVAALVEGSTARGAAREELSAVIAGGASVLEGSSIGADIGAQNITTARSTLDGFDIPLVREDVGGDDARELRLDARNGDVTTSIRRAGENC